ncbi:MAG: radical SAM family heme chaperone HemW [bacterium]|nr:radical SAM family heme chaperone HemW [bacterium]
MNPKKPLEIYVHIPFCARKCLYCDFLSFPLAATQQLYQRYMSALLGEIRYAPRMVNITSEYEITSVFIGGGTPSIVDEVYINKILCELRSLYVVAADAEITLEANPGTLSANKLKAYREAGINRLSIGLQSADPEELKRLGRIHTYEEFLKNYTLARRTGFTNISVDLMTALPGQTMEDLEKTLDQVVSLQPEHISAYSLIIEENTPYALLYSEADLPSEELDREMYAATGRILAEAGYHRYEISNYARKGYESRHNSGYWRRVPYLGFGLGASSLFEETRWKNEAGMESYISQITQEHQPARYEKEQLTQKQQIEEFMFLGLRMTEGIRYCEFKRVFGKEPEAVYGQQIHRLIGDGLLERTGENRDRTTEKDDTAGIRLTARGLDLSNYVFSFFI